MKAASSIFTTIQRPYTIFGISPTLGLFTLGAGCLIFTFSTVFQYQVTGFLITLSLFLVALPYLWIKQRKDYHFEAKLLVIAPAWIGKQKGKAFIAGKKS